MTFYKIIYLYKEGCLQCDYITRLIENNGSIGKKDVFKLNIMSDEGCAFRTKYNIERVPYIIIFDKSDNYIGGAVINTKDDLSNIISNYIF